MFATGSTNSIGIDPRALADDAVRDTLPFCVELIVTSAKPLITGAWTVAPAAPAVEYPEKPRGVSMALARPVGVKSTNVPSETGSPLTSTTFALTTATEEPSAVTIPLSVSIVIVAGIPTV